MQREKSGGHSERSIPIGTVEVAVWDAVAKIEGIPLHRLLARRYNQDVTREEVFCYVGGGWYWPGQTIASIGDVFRFIASPERLLTDPPEENLRDWDRLNASGRRIVAIGGIDAHQVGKRVFGRWVLRPMGYHRSFRLLRTHVLLEAPPTGEVDSDREAVYSALRDGRSYIGADALAPARGFAFWPSDGGGGATLNVRLAQPAEIRLFASGELIRTETGDRLEHRVDAPGSYRVEAHLHALGRLRTWIVSNPIQVG